MPDHPGGKKAIMLYAGKDASEEFNMLHGAWLAALQRMRTQRADAPPCPQPPTC